MGEDFKIKNRYVAVIGGSISGSEASYLLSNRGFKVVVFEMNSLPYGKIEDGLPNWHVQLRNRQMNEIDRKLNNPNILFVPNTKIGRDIKFTDLKNNWGFEAIILANGAWKDRELPVKDIEKFKDKELIYQNSFIHWFNHKHEFDFKGKNYFIQNNTIIIGGGLASLDVVKIVMIELVKKQLFIKKGIDIDLFQLEKEGIDKILDKYQLTLKELEVEKATLIYRRAAGDMPLKSPKDNTVESMKTAKLVSEKLLNKYQEKFLFNFIPQSVPVGFSEKYNKLTGVIFQKTEIKNGFVKPLKNSTFELNCHLLISAIGSIPEPIEGLPYEKGMLKLKSIGDIGVAEFNNVFAVGNAVTGKGNIQESKQHGSFATKLIIENHLKEDAMEKWLVNLNNNIKQKTSQQINTVIDEISVRSKFATSSESVMLKKIDNIYKDIQFQGYTDWIEKKIPIRLEEKIKNYVGYKCL